MKVDKPNSKEPVLELESFLPMAMILRSANDGTGIFSRLQSVVY